MIRGVSKQIIEINETQNEYFEKAMLFVRPSKSDVSVGCLRAQASKLLSGLDNPEKKANSPVKNVIRIVCAAIGGSAVTAVIMLLL